MKNSLVPLKKIVKIHYGKALKAGDRDETGQFPVFGSSGQVGTHNKTLIDYPTLIIGRKGSVGKVTYAESGGWAIDTASPQIGIIKPAHADGHYPVIRVGEIGNREVNLEKCGKVTLSEQETEKFRCNLGDVLLARAIGSESHLGKASMLQETNQTIVFDSHVMRLRFDLNIMLPDFFIQWLTTQGGRHLFMKKAGRTAVQFNVNGKQISSIDIPLPPVHKQREFSIIYSKLMNSLSKGENIQELNNNLFNSLLQRAFRGEL
jgi:type I restriction enzyme, S subunit